ncbi:MAG TPA: ABC transporter permease [Terriglobia bacterium]|nr:ABC transporter permease [Terriglobia bacterium]
MNTPANAVPESFPGLQTITAAATAATRPFYWSVRRELWENRSVYMAPLIAAAIIVFGSLIGLPLRLPGIVRGLPTLDAAQQQAELQQPYDMAAGLLMLAQLLVGVFYCLDALHGERRDRSILFWKSLPVSDRTTVLSKASVPLVILPLLTWAITTATCVIMLLLSSAVLAGSGLSVAPPWARLSLFQMSLMLLYHLVTVHSLWHAPIYGWLLLVSGWARRAVFLWAFLPPLAICALEKIVFNSSHFAAMLGYRLTGGAEAMAMATADMPIDPGTHLTPGSFLITPGLWIGLLVTAAFLAAAVRLRRYRGPI